MIHPRELTALGDANLASLTPGYVSVLRRASFLESV
jgi:hypothetical protein